MDRNGSVAYLGTEGNPKSCLGLEGILEDGWTVELVIAYEGSPLQPTRSRPPGKGVKDLAATLIGLCPTAKRLIGRIMRGRTVSLEFRSMHELCGEYSVPYVSTSDRSLQAVKERLADASPDVILSNGWMFRVTEDVFSLARVIALNCHSSYLPEYRGGNVTYAPLINEEEESGVTVHQLVTEFDAGPILAQRRVRIDPDETPRSLNAKRAQITADVIIDGLQIAGHEASYKLNPPSPFYFRCDRATYRRYRIINFLRKQVGLPIRRYEPKNRYET